MGVASKTRVPWHDLQSTCAWVPSRGKSVESCLKTTAAAVASTNGCLARDTPLCWRVAALASVQINVALVQPAGLWHLEQSMVRFSPWGDCAETRIAGQQNERDYL